MPGSGNRCVIQGCTTAPGNSSFYKPPSAKEKSIDREIWFHNIGKITKTKNPPTMHSRVCYRHFVDDKPTADNPFPILRMGHDDVITTRMEYDVRKRLGNIRERNGTTEKQKTTATSRLSSSGILAPNVCCFLNCTNRLTDGMKFYGIPKAEHARRIWLNSIARPQWNAPSWAKVCEKHYVDGKPSPRNPYPASKDFVNQRRRSLQQDEQPPILVDMEPDRVMERTVPTRTSGLAVLLPIKNEPPSSEPNSRASSPVDWSSVPGISVEIKRESIPVGEPIMIRPTGDVPVRIPPKSTAMISSGGRKIRAVSQTTQTDFDSSDDQMEIDVSTAQPTTVADSRLTDLPIPSTSIPLWQYRRMKPIEAAIITDHQYPTAPVRFPPIVEDQQSMRAAYLRDHPVRELTIPAVVDPTPISSSSMAIASTSIPTKSKVIVSNESHFDGLRQLESLDDANGPPISTADSHPTSTTRSPTPDDDRQFEWLTTYCDPSNPPSPADDQREWSDDQQEEDADSSESNVQKELKYYKTKYEEQQRMIATLEKEMMEANREAEKLRNQRQCFGWHSIMGDDESTKLWTGIASYAELEALYEEHLSAISDNLKLRKGKKDADETRKKKRHQCRVLLPQNEFLFVLIHLRSILAIGYLASIFGIKVSYGYHLLRPWKPHILEKLSPHVPWIRAKLEESEKTSSRDEEDDDYA